MNPEREELQDFDTERFISEVEARPALWDSNDEEYSNRELKRRMWEELVAVFLKEEATPPEKNEFSKVLQRKWKSLRDCYSRELQRLVKLKSGSSVLRKTQYVFYSQLSFLQPVIKSKITCDSTAEAKPPDGGSPENSGTAHKGTAERRPIKRKKPERVSPEVECLVSMLHAGMQALEEDGKVKEDEDRLFLLSLVSQMKKIPPHLRFGVRMQLMQVIHNAIQAKDGSSSPSRLQQDRYGRSTV